MRKSGWKDLRQKCGNPESFENMLITGHIFGKIQCKGAFYFRFRKWLNIIEWRNGLLQSQSILDSFRVLSLYFGGKCKKWRFLVTLGTSQEVQSQKNCHLSVFVFWGSFMGDCAARSNHRKFHKADVRAIKFPIRTVTCFLK